MKKYHAECWDCGEVEDSVLPENIARQMGVTDPLCRECESRNIDWQVSKGDDPQ